jgi:hypothetical protein
MWPYHQLGSTAASPQLGDAPRKVEDSQWLYTKAVALAILLAGAAPRSAQFCYHCTKVQHMATADEIKKENIEKMGEPLGAQYSELWQELASIYIKWGEFIDAFGTARERVELLNRAAPLFFRTAQDALWEASVLHVARLTDPSQSPGGKGKSNLTVQNLPALVADETLKSKLATLIAIALKASEFCRDWRNRHIAHRDL